MRRHTAKRAHQGHSYRNGQMTIETVSAGRSIDDAAFSAGFRECRGERRRVIRASITDRTEIQYGKQPAKAIGQKMLFLRMFHLVPPLKKRDPRKAGSRWIKDAAYLPTCIAVIWLLGFFSLYAAT